MGGLPYCLLLSGAAGLIYEVVWFRQISLVMGHTAFALSAMLVAYLGGLALGSGLAAWLLEKRVAASVQHYVGIEVGVGISALIVPGAFALLSPAFGAAYRSLIGQPILHALVELLLCALILAVPCMLMGASLVVVAAIRAPADRNLTREVGWLYALNTFGGVMGAVCAGLFLLPALGESSTTWIAAGLNAVAAAFAWASASSAPMPSKGPSAQDRSRSPRDWPAPSRIMLAVLYGLGGLAAIVLQVGWARLVVLSVGSNIYGFTLTLASFILGLTLGSGLVARHRLLLKYPVRAIFVLQGLAALLILLSIPWLGALPERVALLMGSDLPFRSLWWVELGLVFSSIAGPTIVMGALFPLVVELIREDGSSSGGATGLAFAANTSGTIGGALVAGYLLIPTVGMRGAIVVSGGLSALLALGWIWPHLDQPRLPRTGSILAAALTFGALGLALFAPGWNQDLFSSGPYMRGYQLRRAAKPTETPGTLIDLVEGPTTVAAVRSQGNVLQLYVGGVSEASNNSPIHRYLAHQGLLLHREPKKVLLIGLGTGQTLGAILQYPVEEVDCLEISPEVVHLSKKHFSEGIALAFEDPRVRLLVQDGRKHLKYAEETYDVIISQPSYPWVSGAARLFTVEFFTEMKSRLRPGGVAVAWLPIRFESSKGAIVAAWRQAYGDRALLYSPDRLLPLLFAVGFGPEGGVDERSVRRLLDYRKVRRAAAALGIRTPADLEDRRYPWPDLSTARINTDDNGFVEFTDFPTLLNERLKLR